MKKESLHSRLQFGRDAFYEKLKAEIPHATAESEIYSELYSVVQNDVKPRLLSEKDLANDYYDLLNEIVLSVIKGLPRFLNNPDFFSMSDRDKTAFDSKDETFVSPEILRQGWLGTIVDRRICDFKKKKYKEESGYGDADGFTVSFEELKENEASENKSGTYYTETMKSNPENRIINRVPSDLLVDRLERIFQLHTKPERIIGFVYSVIIIPLSLSKESSGGRPGVAYEYLQGRSLDELFVSMKQDLNSVLEKDLPEYIFDPLKQRIKRTLSKKDGNSKFTMTAEQIMYASNYIKKKTGIETKKIKSRLSEPIHCDNLDLGRNAEERGNMTDVDNKKGGNHESFDI